MEEFIKSTEEFTPEKRNLYKTLIKKIYLKWAPLLEEIRIEAREELNK
jgi:hypothetical protein